RLSTMLHPLDPLTPQEISSISRAIRLTLVKEQIKAFKFIQASLVPPKKSHVLAFLSIIPRKSSSPVKDLFINPIDDSSHNVILALEKDGWKIEKYIKLAKGVHPQITPEELGQADEAVRRNPQIVKLAAEV
ncbi:13191_t:CDS:2, partial [Acaulospora colombiana]